MKRGECEGGIKEIGGGGCVITSTCWEVKGINWWLIGGYGFSDDNNIGNNVSIVLWSECSLAYRVLDLLINLNQALSFCCAGWNNSWWKWVRGVCGCVGWNVLKLMEILTLSHYDSLLDLIFCLVVVNPQVITRVCTQGFISHWLAALTRTVQYLCFITNNMNKINKSIYGLTQTDRRCTMIASMQCSQWPCYHLSRFNVNNDNVAWQRLLIC